MTYILTLVQLQGETTVPADLLAENADLMALIKQGASFESLVEFVNENW